MIVNIPEAPDAESIKPVLECMEHCVRQEMRLLNHAEMKLTRGAPGEPLPLYDVSFYLAVRFKDDRSAESPVMTLANAERVNNGETVVFRVLKDRMTPDAPPNFGYYDPEFIPPAPRCRECA